MSQLYKVEPKRKFTYWTMYCEKSKDYKDDQNRVKNKVIPSRKMTSSE